MAEREENARIRPGETMPEHTGTAPAVKPPAPPIKPATGANGRQDAPPTVSALDPKAAAKGLLITIGIAVVGVLLLVWIVKRL